VYIKKTGLWWYSTENPLDQLQIHNWMIEVHSQNVAGFGKCSRSREFCSAIHHPWHA